MSKMAYCPNCNDVVEYSNFSLKCKKCGGLIRGDEIDYFEWTSKIDNEKKAYIAKMNAQINGSNTTSVDAQPVETISDEAVSGNTIINEAKTSGITMNTVPSSNSDEIIRHIRRIDEDVHFIKTVVLIYVVLSIIAALIFIIIFASNF